jgi:hypothetical protein
MPEGMRPDELALRVLIRRSQRKVASQTLPLAVQIASHRSRLSGHKGPGPAETREDRRPPQMVRCDTFGHT